MSAVAFYDVSKDRVSQYRLLGGMVLQEFQEFIVLRYSCAAVYMETYLLAEIYKQQSYVRIF